MCAPYKKRGDSSNRVCGIEEKKAAKDRAVGIERKKQP